MLGEGRWLRCSRGLVAVSTDLLYSRELRAPLLRMLHRVVARAPLSLEARGDELNFLSQAVSQLGMAEEAEEEEVEEEEAGGGRRAGSGAGWREVFLDAAEAACCDGVMRAVLAGHSVLELEAVASAEECAALVTEAGGLARRELEARDTTQCCRGGAVQREARPHSDPRPSLPCAGACDAWGAWATR